MTCTGSHHVFTVGRALCMCERFVSDGGRGMVSVERWAAEVRARTAEVARRRAAAPRPAIEVVNRAAYDGPWLMLNLDASIQTLPLEQAMRHELDVGCHCSPTVDVSTPRPLIHHQAIA